MPWQGCITQAGFGLARLFSYFTFHSSWGLQRAQLFGKSVLFHNRDFSVGLMESPSFRHSPLSCVEVSVLFSFSPLSDAASELTGAFFTSSKYYCACTFLICPCLLPFVPSFFRCLWGPNFLLRQQFRAGIEISLTGGVRLERGSEDTGLISLSTEF